MDNKKVVIISDKVVLMGNRELIELCKKYLPKFDVELASFSFSSDTIKSDVQKVVDDTATKIVFVNGFTLNQMLLKTIEVASMVRKSRKDIFLVGIHSRSGCNEQEIYLSGLRYLKEGSCNLVFVRDNLSSKYMVVAPEETTYHVSNKIQETLTGLFEIIGMRTHLTFTQSKVVDGKPVPWNDPIIPDSLRKVIDYCISQNAYRPFNGVTAGHFAFKINDTTFLSSIRKTNFNDVANLGLVKIVTDGPDTVLAFGAKPSVGGQSQRIVFKDHPEYDCICHFHCPIKEGSEVPVMSQREFECGSHECGQNTSNGLKKFGNLSATHLDNHGPNIVFNSKIDPQEVINFIDANWDLTKKTGGYVSTSK